VFPELEALHGYVTRATAMDRIGKSLGNIYYQIRSIPELEEYMDHEVDEASEYHTVEMEKLRINFQENVYSLLIDKPSDPSKIFFKAYMHQSDKHDSLIRFEVDYGPDLNRTIKVTFDNISEYFNLKFRFKQDKVQSYHDSEHEIFTLLDNDYYHIKNPFPSVHEYDGNDKGTCRNFTFQVTEGCNLRCSYCFPEGTPVTLPDLSQVDISALKVGNKVLGFDEYPIDGRFRHFNSTEVTHVFKRKSRCIKIDSLAFDQPIITTPEHPFLTSRGWVEAQNLREKDHLYRVNHIENVEQIDTTDVQYQTGYFIAGWLGDGCILDRDNCSDGYHRYFMRFVVKDHEMMERMRDFSKNIGFDFMESPFKLSARNTENSIRSNKKDDFEKFQSLLIGNLSKNVLNRDKNFMAGYLAGLFDSEGSNDGSTIRFTNTDLFLLYWAQESLSELGFEYTMDKLSPTVNKIKTSIRILGGVTENIRFLRTIQPAISRKGIEACLDHLEFNMIRSVIEISNISKEEYTVYNIETESHTFVANDILVHNCYQTCKKNSIMSYETACSAVDDLLSGKFEYLSPGFSKSIILDFIGGDPLLEIELIQRIYEYFLQEAYRLNHPWFYHHRLSMCSNGMLYFNKATKAFFDKYARQTSFNISIDGNKALHDSCRVQPTGEGSYDVGIAGVLHSNEVYKIDISSKMTLAPSNIPFIKESVKNLCIDNPYPGINLNVVFEDVWSTEDAKVLYEQMKGIADMVFEYERPDLYFSIFRHTPLSPPGYDPSETLTNICGGAGAMLSISPDGKYYPCIRYMPSSLNGEARELVIGNTETKMDMSNKIIREFNMITYMSQQNDRCLSCPMCQLCNWCMGYCYQAKGTCNERTTYICDLIKAEYLASIYYWANMAIKYPEYQIHVDEELAPYYHFEDIISEDEYENLQSYIMARVNVPLADDPDAGGGGVQEGQSGSIYGSASGAGFIDPHGYDPGAIGVPNTSGYGLSGSGPSITLNTNPMPSGRPYCASFNGGEPDGQVTARKGTDSAVLKILCSGAGDAGIQLALWARLSGLFGAGDAKDNSQAPVQPGYWSPDIQAARAGGSTAGKIYWIWEGGGQTVVTLDDEGEDPPDDEEEEGECGTCNDTCTDSCSEASDCKHDCLNSCNLGACDNNCSGVCVAVCDDHCNESCELACTGCNNVCTSCNQSCQDQCIVTCQNECAACRQNCKNEGMSETDCRKMCRQCDSMCIENCTMSCITWNSGGTNSSGTVRANSQVNDWKGFTNNDAPQNATNHYNIIPTGGPLGINVPSEPSHPQPTVNWNSGANATPQKTWNYGVINKYDKKTELPYGYARPYDGNKIPTPIGGFDGTRGDWDHSKVGEEEYVHTNDTDRNRSIHDFNEDLDWDKKRGL
jgi:radical SAM peptide maturase (CXXX-repeat target family)